MTVNVQVSKRVDYAYNAISQAINKYRYSGNNLVAETNYTYDQSDRLTNVIYSKRSNTILKKAERGNHENQE
ncbi:MAG: hypothetical protein ACKO7R_16845 [Pseudanabaena sp.]